MNKPYLNQNSGVVDITDKITRCSSSDISFNEYDFELFKLNRVDRRTGTNFDVYTCKKKRKCKCKMNIRRNCQTNSFYLMKIHSTWLHNHGLDKLIKKNKKMTEKQKLEVQIKIMKNKDKRKNPLPVDTIFHEHLSYSGIFRELPDEVIIHISCFIEYEKLYILRESSEYLRYVLKKEQFFRAYSKNVFRINFEDIKKSMSEKCIYFCTNTSYHSIIDRYYHKIYVPELDKKMDEVISMMENEIQKDLSSLNNLRKRIPRRIVTKKFVLRALSKNHNFITCFREYLDDRDVIIIRLKQTRDGEIYLSASQEIKNDIDVALETLKIFYEQFGVNSSGLKTWFGNYILQNPHFFMRAVELDPMYFLEAPKSVQRNKEVAIAAIRKKRSMYNYLDEDLKNEWDVIQANSSHS